MPRKDPRIDAYIANAAPFARPILKHIRKIVHTGAPDVVETVKWSMPHFEHSGIMCGMGAFKAHCAFGFWKSELIFGKAPAGEDAMGHFGRITAVSDLPADDVLIGYVRKAVELNEAGVKPPRQTKPKEKKTPLTVPDYFTLVLKKNAAARKTFENLSPSGQREYVEWLTEAKRESTRAQRLDTSIEWLAEGKPRMWKYQAKSA
jgi:uncharacterized protein YdeI (YjbR/CyaY-like superfamily)